MSNLKYWLWLTSRVGVSGQGMAELLSHFGTPESAYFADRHAYESVAGLSEKARRSFQDKSLSRVDQILGDCDRLGIRIMTIQDAIYPERLRAIHQPPLVLYWKGRDIAVDNEAAVAVVGTRSATPYGVRIAEQLGLDLTRAGALVVSGIAEGIDAAAVRGALKAGGPVISVLGGGIDFIYPRFHRDLYADVAAAGALVSEYPPGTESRSSHFPVRNRIIPGCCGGGESPHRRQPDHRRTRPGPGSGGLCRPRTGGRAKQRGHQSPDSGGGGQAHPGRGGRGVRIRGPLSGQVWQIRRPVRRGAETAAGESLRCTGPAQARPSSPGKRG